MKFSVIVPTQNDAKSLESLLQALEDQSIGRDNFEVIIIAAQDDEAFELVENQAWKLNTRINSLPFDVTHGRSRAAKRNYGAQLARNPWLAFTDDHCSPHVDWLKNASGTASPDLAGIEGYTHVPEPEKRTQTYEKLMRISLPGGFQTCNMFYRKEAFLMTGGFDPNFPDALADLDFAWSLLDKGHRITYCSEVRVELPVPSNTSSNPIADCGYFKFIPHLAKKHPKAFAESSIQVFPTDQGFLLILDIFAILSLLFFSSQIFFFILLMRLSLTAYFVLREFYRLHFTPMEILKAIGYNLLCPILGFYHLVRGNIENRTAIYYKSP